MASGKSTIGSALSKKLYMNFIDLDAYISKQENSTIPEIFKLKGEIYFRQIESKYLKEILNLQEDFVLSLGGGTPCYANNMDLILNSKAKSIYINVKLPTLVARIIQEKSNRPLVANLDDEKITEFVAKHLFERRFYYEQAELHLNTNDKVIEEIVSEIRMALY